jgi:hypothetical protein
MIIHNGSEDFMTRAGRQAARRRWSSRDCGALHKAAHALIAVVTHAEVKPNLVGLRTGRECLDCPERIRTRQRLPVVGSSHDGYLDCRHERLC